ncbi:unnamed protein product [Cylindrotheca closterium]|uniref:SET domain-containing protein n=1 Tax=Cylindrotheca closterium TaxID=2856 RepID=A0AAD2FC18_9STRA|nr:unnamed protein product [Cylindrotheca closterium]
MVSSSAFDSDDDFIFGVDLSNLDVSEIVDEGISSFIHEEESSQSYQKPDYSSRITNLLSTTTRFPVLETPVTQLQFDNLFSWATSIGAELDGIACVEDIYGGRGLAARQKFVVGDMLAILPRELRIGQTVACKHLGIPSDTPDLSALSMFLLDLASSEESEEKFLHYARCLPKFGSNGLFQSDEDDDHYDAFGEEYTEAIKAIRSQAKSCKDYIYEVLIGESPLEDQAPTIPLLWAISMVQTRTHGFGSNRGRWLTPIFDFANHSPNPNSKLEGDSDGRLVLRALKAIDANEDITIDYQVPDDSKLRATYGFSLLHAPRNTV